VVKQKPKIETSGTVQAVCLQARCPSCLSPSQQHQSAKGCSCW